MNEKIKAYYVADDIDEILNYIDNLEQENERLKEIENKLNFIKNRVKQGMSQENINKCAIAFLIKSKPR